MFVYEDQSDSIREEVLGGAVSFVRGDAPRI